MAFFRGHESAGKRQRAGTRRGNQSLRQALTLAAWANPRLPGSRQGIRGFDGDGSKA